MSIWTGTESLNDGYFAVYYALPSGLRLHLREDDERNNGCRRTRCLSKGG